jgi:cephalosporin hydroxylase
VTVDPDFAEERRRNMDGLRADAALRRQANEFLVAAGRHRYSYNFDWLGLPIIQFPTDIVAIQELVWRVRPRVIVETGVARGGSLALSASLLELIGGDGFVIGIDIEISARNRAAIEAHPLAHRIRLIEGSSTAPPTVSAVRGLTAGSGPVLVLLDSMHTHDHVLEELRLYSPLVQSGSYVVVFDTVIEDMPQDSFPDRPWSRTSSPKSAVRAFLAENGRFAVDDDIEVRLQVTVAPGGYLRCVADSEGGKT